MSRHRTRTLNLPGGTATWYTSALSPRPSSYQRIEDCTDLVGFWDRENPFYLFRHSNHAWSVYGRSHASGFGWSYNGYVMTHAAGAHFTATSPEPSDNETLSEALARTNPNRSVIDTPVFFAELREIPKLIQHFAELGMKRFKKRPIREIASNYLTWEYGIKPFTSDLVKMMDFVNHTEKRLRELRNLQQGKRGLGRKWTVWRDETPPTSPWVTVATGLYSESNRISASYFTKREKWASTRWVPTIDISTLSDDQLRNRANRAVFGTDLSFATLWEAMPWSWLIDWFSNVGDIMSLSRGTIPVKHDGSCVMRRTVTRAHSIRPYDGPGLGYFSVSSSHGIREELVRTPWSFGPLPEFNLPFLNGRQLSILSAISVTRRR